MLVSSKKKKEQQRMLVAGLTIVVLVIVAVVVLLTQRNLSTSLLGQIIPPPPTSPGPSSSPITSPPTDVLSGDILSCGFGCTCSYYTDAPQPPKTPNRQQESVSLPFGVALAYSTSGRPYDLPVEMKVACEYACQTQVDLLNIRGGTNRYEFKAANTKNVPATVEAALSKSLCQVRGHGDDPGQTSPTDAQWAYQLSCSCSVSTTGSPGTYKSVIVTEAQNHCGPLSFPDDMAAVQDICINTVCTNYAKQQGKYLDTSRVRVNKMEGATMLAPTCS